MSELISIVIPTYNRGGLIRDCVENLLRQTYQSFEIIVVDDGSLDNTKEVMEQMNDSRIRYYRLEQNQGACAARNKGVELSRGNYIAFQDSDDLWDEKKLEKQMDYLIEHDADVVFCSMRRVKDGKTQFVVPERFIPDSQIMKELCKSSCISTQMIFGKKSCFLEERFDTAMPRYQDYDLMLRIAQKYKVAHLPEVLVSQQLCEDSISNNWEKFRTAVELLADKYRGIPGFTYNLYLETGYRNYYADYGFRSKTLFKKALKEQFTIKALLLYLIPDFILGPYIRKKNGGQHGEKRSGT